LWDAYEYCRAGMIPGMVYGYQYCTGSWYAGTELRPVKVALDTGTVVSLQLQTGGHNDRSL